MFTYATNFAPSYTNNCGRLKSGKEPKLEWKTPPKRLEPLSSVTRAVASPVFTYSGAVVCIFVSIFKFTVIATFRFIFLLTRPSSSANLLFKSTPNFSTRFICLCKESISAWSWPNLLARCSFLFKRSNALALISSGDKAGAAVEAAACSFSEAVAEGPSEGFWTSLFSSLGSFVSLGSLETSFFQ